VVNLNSLTVKCLKKLAEECSIVLDIKANKPDHIKKIKKSSIPEKKLEQLFKKYFTQLKKERDEKKGKKKTSISSTTPQFYKDFLNLKEDYYTFKSNLNTQLQSLLSEIKILKSAFNISEISKKSLKFDINITELENQIYLIYNQLRNRPHQAIKIEYIWKQIQQKNPDYKWETFVDQILKIHSSHFHLEEGTARLYINDPNNNKKYAYVIGN